MYIYTYDPHRKVHLKLPVPLDWNMSDVEFFITGKAHLEVRDVPSPVSAPIVESVPEKEPELITVVVPAVAMSRCPKHPTYTGKRLGKNVKDCPICHALYNKIHGA